MKFHRASPAAARDDPFAQRYEYNQLAKGSSFPCSAPLYQPEIMLSSCSREYASSCYATRRHCVLLFSSFGYMNFHHAHCHNTALSRAEISTVEVRAKLSQ